MVYADLFAKGNHREALDKLSLLPLTSRTDWPTYRSGLCAGACAILALFLMGKEPSLPGSGLRETLSSNLFRALGTPILSLWGFAFVMMIWNMAKVDYVCLFDKVGTTDILMIVLTRFSYLDGIQDRTLPPSPYLRYIFQTSTATECNIPL